METKEQKPWYHGVKWRLETRKTEGHPSDTVIVTEKDGHGYVARMWNGRSNRDQWAELLAAAPETAAERDSLLSVNKQLLEALEKMVHAATYGTFDHADSHPLPTARAAILAAKASS